MKELVNNFLTENKLGEVISVKYEKNLITVTWYETSYDDDDNDVYTTYTATVNSYKNALIPPRHWAEYAFEDWLSERDNAVGA